MTTGELCDSGRFRIINRGEDPDRQIEAVFCCDLLSIVMSRGIEGAAWVTVMGNINTIAVLALTDMALIILAEGVQMDAAGLAKAQQEGITVLASDKAIFDIALEIHEMIA